MSENKVKLGNGVADGVKEVANQEMLEIGKQLIGIISKYAKEKIQGINLDEVFSKKNQEEIISMWSTQLAQKGIVPKGYAGLPEDILVSNLHQEGYLDGLYAGYILALTAMVDNGATKELTVSVRDELRPNLIGHHYNDREEFTSKIKDKKYSWINTAKREE